MDYFLVNLLSPLPCTFVDFDSTSYDLSACSLYSFWQQLYNHSRAMSHLLLVFCRSFCREMENPMRLFSYDLILTF